MYIPTYDHYPSLRSHRVLTPPSNYYTGAANISFETTNIEVTDAHFQAKSASEIYLRALIELGDGNPLLKQLADKLPSNLLPLTGLPAFEIVARVVDLEKNSDRVHVRFRLADKTPVVLHEPTADFPSDKLVGQLILLLAK